MQDTLWDPDRLAAVGWLVTRYSSHLEAGDRIRLGVEGDPAAPYRSAEDAPSARVTEVTKHPDGLVTFRAAVEGTNVTLDLDNRNVSADRVWEVHPDHLDAFQTRVQASLRAADEVPLRGAEDDAVHARAHDDRHADDDDPSSPDRRHDFQVDASSVAAPTSTSADRRHDFHVDASSVAAPTSTSADRRHDFDPAQDYAAEFRSSLDDVNDRVRRLELTVASSLRQVAGDMMRAYRGEEPVFAGEYCASYDATVETRVMDEEEEYAGGERGSKSRGLQAEKYDFAASDDGNKRGGYVDHVTEASYVSDE